MINWQTAFVIAVAMICGAALINKPSDAHINNDHICEIYGFGEIEDLDEGGNVNMHKVQIQCEHN